MVTKEKWDALKKRMDELSIYEEDLEEKFILGSGSGGQKINKTSSTVFLKHNPSQIQIKCGQDRSQALNRFLARKELCEKIAEKEHKELSKKVQEMEKIRRQKKRRSRKSKEKILQEKRELSDKKIGRKSPTLDEN